MKMLLLFEAHIFAFKYTGSVMTAVFNQQAPYKLKGSELQSEGRGGTQSPKSQQFFLS